MLLFSFLSILRFSDFAVVPFPYGAPYWFYFYFRVVVVTSFDVTVLVDVSPIKRLRLCCYLFGELFSFQGLSSFVPVAEFLLVLREVV